MEETIKQQWVKLLGVRSAIANRLPGATTKEIREQLFEAHQAIGYALLYLERVEYKTDAISRKMTDSKAEAQPERIIGADADGS